MNRIRPGLIICIFVTLCFGLALWLRISPPFDKIFTGAGIRYATVDAYYHMTVVDNLAHNFPKLTPLLPYLLYPGGQGSPAVYFFVWLLSAVIWIASLGNPSEHIVDVISVYYPAVLGALTVIPVYFIGKALMGRWAGIIAAALIAILPGEFLGRSILGSTDQHVAESLYTAVTMLFLILAVKTAGEKKLSYANFRRPDWASMAKPLLFSLLAGFFLGIYLLTWFGALFFVFIIFLYFVIQLFIGHLRRESTEYLGMVSLIVFLVAALMFLPARHDSLNLSALIIACIFPPVLNGISRTMANRQLKPIYFPLTVVGLGLAGLAGLYLVAPSLFRLMLESFGIFHPTGASLTTLEMQPILKPSGTFTLALVWGNFTVSFFLSLIGLLLLIYMVVRRGEADKSLLLVWSLVTLAATIGQRRFAYYYAVNAAVLTGFISAWVFEQCGITKLSSPKEKNFFALVMGIVATLFLIPVFISGFLNTFTWLGIPALIVFFVALYIGQKDQVRHRGTSKRPAPSKSEFHINRLNFNTAHINLVFSLFMVFTVVFFPTIRPAIDTANGASFAPSDGWMESLTWMRNNTPEPFGNPDFYYQLAPANMSYPESAYGVLSWWDYGYWITRIARRIPNVNPSQDPVLQKKVATIFTSLNETQANEIATELGTAYVIIDDQTALGKFWAVATWAGKSPAEFSDVYYLPQQNQLTPVQLFYPEYYRSLVIRLYNFDGKAFDGRSPTSNETGTSQNQTFVISYEDRKTSDGIPFKLVTSAESFDNYEAAEAFRISKNSTSYRIVGVNPFLSPVPLDAVQDYKPVFSSTQTFSAGAGGVVPEIKIFEFSGKTSQNATQ